MTRKSYWQNMVTDSVRAQDAIRSWFTGLAEGMTCEKAEVLCDIETDREKKLRVVMIDAEGGKRLFSLTRGRHFTIITSKRFSPPPARLAGMKWTSDEITRLRELWSGPDTTREIGVKMDRSHQSIIGKAHRLDLPDRRPAVTETPRPHPLPPGARTLPPMASERL